MARARAHLRQQSLALTVSLVALFFALGGGPMIADAARKLTGQQIAKNAIKSKHVKNRSLKRRDFAPGQLPAGVPGPQGIQGPQGERGPEGPAGPFPDGNLPSGKTLRGNFYADDFETSTGGEAFSSISFGFQLASEPTVEIRTAASPPTAGCPGSVSNPQAAPGRLCIYVNAGPVMNTRDPVTGAYGAANRWGTAVTVYNSNSSVFAYGTWAVTAP